MYFVILEKDNEKKPSSSMAELFGIKSKFMVYSESLFVKFCPQNPLSVVSV